MQLLVVDAFIVPLEDIIVQPFTGRVVRQILFKIAERVNASELLDALSSSAPHKPYSITPLYLNGIPLYKSPGKSSPICLKKGVRYSFRASFIVKDIDTIKILYGFLEDIEIYNSRRVRVNIARTEILDENALGVSLKPKNLITLCFETPTLLQLPKLRRRSRVNRYLLFPLPSLIIRSLKESWNKYAEKKVSIASWRANYALVAVDYSLKPVTVFYDSRKKPRGFVGYTTYRVMTWSPRMLGDLSRLLHYATLTNVGKSRSIGFGVTTIASYKQGRCRKILDALGTGNKPAGARVPL